jgi:hypothetical protein
MNHWPTFVEEPSREDTPIEGSLCLKPHRARLAGAALAGAALILIGDPPTHHQEAPHSQEHEQKATSTFGIVDRHHNSLGATSAARRSICSTSLKNGVNKTSSAPASATSRTPSTQASGGPETAAGSSPLPKSP